MLAGTQRIQKRERAKRICLGWGLKSRWELVWLQMCGRIVHPPYIYQSIPLGTRDPESWKKKRISNEYWVPCYTLNLELPLMIHTKVCFHPIALFGRLRNL